MKITTLNVPSGQIVVLPREEFDRLAEKAGIFPPLPPEDDHGNSDALAFMDATIARHAPVAVPEQPAKPKPTHCRVDALVATELVERFERAADGAGVRVSAALEDALTQWIQRNGTA